MRKIWLGFYCWSTFLLTAVFTQQKTDNLWDSYKKCNETFGKTDFLCDPNKRLEPETAEELVDLLWRFQTEIPCYCKFSRDCYRYGNVTIQSGVMAGMIIVDALPENVDETTKKIYEDSHLGTKACSNGLLIVYAIKTDEIYTYRGKLTEEHLSRDQAIEAMNDTVEFIRANNDVHHALPKLLRTYTTHLKGVTYRRQKSWEAIVGMVVAALICAIAAAFALAIFFSGCCFKKRKRPTTPSPMVAPVPVRKPLTAAQRRQLELMAPPPKSGSKKGAPAKKQAAIRAAPGTIPPQQQFAIPPVQPSQMDEPYYMVSEPPSTMYSTLPRSTLGRYQTGAGAADPYGVGYPARVDLYGTVSRSRTMDPYGAGYPPYGGSPYGAPWPVGAAYGPPAAQSSPVEGRQRRHSSPTRQWPLHWERETQSKECLVGGQQQPEEGTARVK